MSVRDPSETAPRHSSQVHLVRAAVVVGCFVVATIVLLGPASHRSAGAPATTTTTTTTVPQAPVVKSAVSVQAANGTTASAHPVQNLGSQYEHLLSNKGWAALPALDASTAPTHTIVYFAPRFQRAAKMVVQDLGLSPTTVVTVRTGATGVVGAANDDVIVVLGPDAAG